jgi:integrase
MATLYTSQPAVRTVADAVAYWLQHRAGDVQPTTYRGYKQVSLYIIGPLLVGNRTERFNYSRHGRVRTEAEFIEMLGACAICNLTTAQIRAWHKIVTTHVGPYTAHVAKKFLRAALSLAAEDYGLPLPAMPSRLGRRRTLNKKVILTPDQVGQLLEAAQRDDVRGVYYAFPFLTGVRPSEQLGLLWGDIDFDLGLICIRRSQLPDRTITNMTKTDASIRDIPMAPLLRTMLLNWRKRCPAGHAPDRRVFPCLGSVGAKSAKTRGRPLGYTNFVYTYWRPSLRALGLPPVTPHSARHVFISTLQASGIEVGLVAQLAGHKNASVTLAHYTQAVRGGQPALHALEKAYMGHGV